MSAKAKFVLALTALTFLDALVFSCIYWIFSFHTGPHSWPLRNRFTDLWFSLLLVFYAFQGLLLQTDCLLRGQSSYFVILQNAYYIISAILFLEMSASWDVFGRLDVTLWAVALITMNIANIYVVSTRYSQTRRRALKRTKRRRLRQIGQLGEETALISDDASSTDDFIDTDSDSGEVSKMYCWKVLHGVNYVLQAGVLMCCFLLMHGAFIHGNGTQSYPPHEGKFFELRDPRHESTQRLYYRCHGNNTALPVVVLEGEPHQGIGPWLGVLDALTTKHGVRACAFDKPGLGYSAEAFPDQLTQDYYGHMIGQLAEMEAGSFGPPYAFVTYGLGANAVLGVTNASLVAREVFIEPLRPRLARRALEKAANLTAEEIELLLGRHFRAELDLLDFLTGFGAPLGLLKFLVAPRNTSSWSERNSAELRWYETTEKMWAMRRWQLLALHLQHDHFALEKGFRPRVDVMTAAWSRDRVVADVCEAGRLSQEACDLEVAVSREMVREREAMAQGGGQVIRCQGCPRGYSLYEGAEDTAAIIFSLLSDN